MSYVIKDENGEVMRIVGRQEEAKNIALDGLSNVFANLNLRHINLRRLRFER